MPGSTMRLALGALLACASVAHANGRPPLTNGVAFSPSDPHELLVRTTFGMLLSHDDGCTFRWVCEDAIGYGGQFDPKYAIAADGTIFATTFKGLRLSRDAGCTWETASHGIGPIWIDALDIGPTGDVWIATAENAMPNNVYRSSDNGATFVPRGMLSPTIWWKSVKVARRNAQRVYVTGYQVSGPPDADGGTPPPTAYFERSDDGGGSWTPSALTGMRFGVTPIILASAVDPVNPDILYVTSMQAAPPAGDVLYRSIDGGATFTEVLTTSDSIRDVVFHGGTVMVATLGGGSFAATDGATFTALTDAPQLGCLGDRDGKLVGCGANWQPDFKAVATSADGQTWSKVWRFVELAGPLTCAAGTTTADKCNGLWPALQQQFASTGPTCGSEQFDTPPVVEDPGSEPPAPHAGSGGCCDAGGAAPVGAALLAGIALLVGFRRKKSCCK